MFVRLRGGEGIPPRDDIQGPALRFAVDAAYVLSDDADGHQLHAAEEEDDDEQGGPAPDEPIRMKLFGKGMDTQLKAVEKIAK